MTQLFFQPRLRLKQLVSSATLIAVILAICVYNGFSSEAVQASRPVKREFQQKSADYGVEGSPPHLQGELLTHDARRAMESLAQRPDVANSAAQQQVAHVQLARRAVDPNSIGNFDDRVEKGRKLVCLFAARNEQQAQQINGGKPLASVFTQWSDLARWGWDEIDEGNSRVTHYGDTLDEAFEALGIDTSQTVQLGVDQDKEYGTDAGLNGDVSNAAYFNDMNFQSGAIIADYNTSTQGINPRADSYPDLQQWSDLVFLQWQQNSGNSIQNLDYIFRAHVVNSDTQSQVITALNNMDITEWPQGYANRVTFGMDSDNGCGILGSKNGAGSAYLVAQHKAQLGVRKITQVEVWTKTGGQMPKPDSPLCLTSHTPKVIN